MKGLPILYRRKLAPLDSRYHNTPHFQTGPLVRRLEKFGRLQGFVVGPQGEFGKDLHSLLRVIGETKVAAWTRARGRPASDIELGAVIA